MYEIETEDKEITKEVKKLENKFKKQNINKEINKLIINENNIYPKFYAWWDENKETVEIYLYETK